MNSSYKVDKFISKYNIISKCSQTHEEKYMWNHVIYIIIEKEITYMYNTL